MVRNLLQMNKFPIAPIVEMIGMRMRAATVCETKVATPVVKPRMQIRASQGLDKGNALVIPSDK